MTWVDEHAAGDPITLGDRTYLPVARRTLVGTRRLWLFAGYARPDSIEVRGPTGPVETIPIPDREMHLRLALVAAALVGLRIRRRRRR